MTMYLIGICSNLEAEAQKNLNEIGKCTVQQHELCQEQLFPVALTQWQDNKGPTQETLIMYPHAPSLENERGAPVPDYIVAFPLPQKCNERGHVSPWPRICPKAVLCLVWDQDV